MSPEMRDDAELLSHICDSAPIVRDRQTGIETLVCAKVLACWTSLSVQTISEYRSGVRNIPTSFWRAILTRWHNPGIVNLLIPDDYHAELIDFKEPVPLTSTQFFRDAVEESGLFAEKQKHLANILADGDINELDRQDIMEYHDAFLEQRQTSDLLHRAVMGKLEQHNIKGGVS